MPKVVGEIKSKTKIRETVYSLLKEKDFSEIKVSEVCRLAKINRTTFYNDYENMYDVLTDLEVSFLIRMKQSISNLSYSNIKPSQRKANLMDLITFFDKNDSEYLIYLKADKFITTNLCTHMKTIIMGNEFDKPNEYHFIKEFISILSIISTWLLENKPISIEELAQILM